MRVNPELFTLPLLAGFLFPAMLPAQTGKPIKINGTLAVINDRVITLLDVNRELGTRHLTDPQLRNNQKKIKAEKNLLLRRLARQLLLEQAIYHLEYEATQIEQVLAMQVNMRLEHLRKKTGSTRAFLAELKSQGMSISEKRLQIQREMKWQIVLQELVNSKFAGQKGLLLVRPGEMQELYDSSAWKWARIRPALANIKLHKLQITPDRNRETCLKLMNSAARNLASDQSAPLPEGIKSRDMIIVNCLSMDLEEVKNSLGIFDTPNRDILSGDKVTKSISSFLFSTSKPGNLSKPMASSNAVILIEVIKQVPQSTTPFTDPGMQNQLKSRLLIAKRHAAEQALVRELWAKARIWPATLKKAGPPGLQAPGTRR